MNPAYPGFAVLAVQHLGLNNLPKPAQEGLADTGSDQVTMSTMPPGPFSAEGSRQLSLFAFMQAQIDKSKSSLPGAQFSAVRTLSLKV